MLRDHAVDAVERSALRVSELRARMSAVPRLDPACFRHVSVPAPSTLQGISERECAEYRRSVW